MNRSFRGLGVWMVAAVAVVVPAGLAWACVGVVSLTTDSATVQPGGTVTVTGKEFADSIPIEIHLDAVTGPLLATVPPGEDTMTSKFSVPVVIPASAANGPHLLIATQEYHNMNTGSPARAQVYVGTAPPAPATPAVRPATVTFSSGPSAVALVLIGLAAAGVALIVFGLVYLMASRPPTTTETAGVPR